MSKKNKNKSHRRVYFVGIAVVIALPLLYVLSIGPAAIIYKKCPKSHHAFLEFYHPVIWLYENTALQRPIGWYAHLWGLI